MVQRRERFLLVLLLAIAVVVVVRAALPTLVKDFVNDRLNSLEAYEGSVAAVDMALWRGAYQIEGIRIRKRDGAQLTPFFTCDRIDFSVEWRNLLKGSIIGEASFEQPSLNLIQSSSEQHSQLGKEVNWAARLEELFPFRFNTLTVHNGTVSFRAPGIRTQDALVARHIEVRVSNLTNVIDRRNEAFADFRLEARVLEDGHARINGSINPLARTPTFDVNLAVDGVKLPQVNPWLRQYIKADAASGDFQLYLEVAAADGRFKGYAKPLMQNVDLHGTEDEDKPALRRLWEGAVDFAAKIFENEDKEQVAARIPFSGTIQNPKAGVLQTVISVLRNAFIGAFANSLEGSISIRAVEKDLHRHDLRNADKKANDDNGARQRDLQSDR